ncbi:DUF2059 domain-containing protein [Eleftheria terrae]|uniref:DUF2059 domain-containing protein n=1 Tax=Eleftheria terrae TaxID=1597781 RepID=UPI00263B15CE|nr:DUF2059 domain-containing protein [Eleftheria terrae]WKB54022.1 DUF2059 domain-containing protein [Eleftheria terrae]
MNKRMLALCMAWALSGAAGAAAPTVASIEELLEVSGAEQTTVAMQSQVDELMKREMDAAFEGRTLTPELQQAMDRFRDKAAAILRETTSWSRMKDVHVRLYAETLTQEEVDSLLAFYRSPGGQAVLNKMPLLMQRTMLASQERMRPALQQLLVAQQELRAELARMSAPARATTKPAR